MKEVVVYVGWLYLWRVDILEDGVLNEECMPDQVADLVKMDRLGYRDDGPFEETLSTQPCHATKERVVEASK